MSGSAFVIAPERWLAAKSSANGVTLEGLLA